MEKSKLIVCKDDGSEKYIYFKLDLKEALGIFSLGFIDIYAYNPVDDSERLIESSYEIHQYYSDGFDLVLETNTRLQTSLFLPS